MLKPVISLFKPDKANNMKAFAFVLQMEQLLNKKVLNILEQYLTTSFFGNNTQKGL